MDLEGKGRPVLGSFSWVKSIVADVREQILLGFRALYSPSFYPALLLGFGAWLLPEPAVAPAPESLILAGFAEEVVFRLFVQGELRRLLRNKYLLPGLSLANILTSGIFAAVHFVHHPPLWALSVFFPSLVFGWAMDRYRSVFPPAILHICYNLLFFYRL